MLEAKRVKAAVGQLAIATTEQKNRALYAIAERIRAAEAQILAANAADLAAAEHLPPALVGRLTLTPAKVANLVASVEQIAELPDPVGEELERIERPNGLVIRKVRVPLGVIGMIYEARPNVTVDAAALCLKAGNGVVLKGGREAYQTNVALAEQVRQGLADAGFSPDLVALLGAGREAATALMEAVGEIDALIPRGGPGLIAAVVRQARVPVIQTGAGVCHTYVHASADVEQALAVVANAKLSNPGVCNALETLLVDEALAPSFLPKLPDVLPGVELWADAEARRYLPTAQAAAADQWGQEYLGLALSIRVVTGLDEALAHIAQWGTQHSEAILTTDVDAARRFQAEVDAAAVYVNASTRFTDGGEFGFGAEMGISTQKLHARGPMGLRELTSYKYLIDGSGQIR